MNASAFEALRDLRDALQRFAGALASGDHDAVLAAERPLADAVRQLPANAGAVSAGDRARMRALVEENQMWLQRCQRLGAAARDLAALSGRFSRHAYAPSGALVPAPSRPTLVSRS